MNDVGNGSLKDHLWQIIYVPVMSPKLLRRFFTFTIYLLQRTNSPLATCSTLPTMVAILDIEVDYFLLLNHHVVLKPQIKFQLHGTYA